MALGARLPPVPPGRPRCLRRRGRAAGQARPGRPLGERGVLLDAHRRGPVRAPRGGRRRPAVVRAPAADRVHPPALARDPLPRPADAGPGAAAALVPARRRARRGGSAPAGWAAPRVRGAGEGGRGAPAAGPRRGDPRAPARELEGGRARGEPARARGRRGRATLVAAQPGGPWSGGARRRLGRLQLLGRDHGAHAQLRLPGRLPRAGPRRLREPVRRGGLALPGIHRAARGHDPRGAPGAPRGPLSSQRRPALARGDRPRLASCPASPRALPAGSHQAAVELGHPDLVLRAAHGDGALRRPAVGWLAAARPADDGAPRPRARADPQRARSGPPRRRACPRE